MSTQDGRPQRTSINGQPAEWTPRIWRRWHAVVDRADPKTFADVTVQSANYFSPRPYVDEWNRGSTTAGFVYTIGRSVYCTEWTCGQTPAAAEHSSGAQDAYIEAVYATQEAADEAYRDAVRALLAEGTRPHFDPDTEETADDWDEDYRIVAQAVIGA